MSAEQRTQRLSPAAFDILQRELLHGELSGLGPDAATRYACAMIGYWPKDGTETILIVDHSLTQPHIEVAESASTNEVPGLTK